MKPLCNRVTLFSSVAALALLGCGQAPSPSEQQAATPVAQEKAAPVPTDRLAVTALGEMGGAGKGREVYVRVAVDDKPLLPASGLASGAWTESSPGIYLYVGGENAAPATLEWDVPASTSRMLYFSNTEQSGKVKVSWKGVTATYDLSSQPGAAPKPPIDLNKALPTTP